MFKKILFILGIIAIGTGAWIAFKWYNGFLKPNVTDNESFLYVATGSSFEELMQNIKQHQILDDTATFRWAAEKKDYIQRVRPGKYRLEKGMNNRRLVNMLLAGLQEPVQFRFQNLRLRGQFANAVAAQLEPDSASIMQLMNTDSLAAEYGFNTENFFCMFIPNTYEFFWNTSKEDFFARMHQEYQTFWNDKRRAAAEAADLTPIEVGILASIVKGEALHVDEMPKIAGLYLNRLKKGMLLQADPTVIFATQDFTIRRVLNRHLRTPSPYNTYIHKGLPPGPIMMPSIAAIDAVLNADQHNYLYMCAKDDFSGYHNFAKTVREHLVNARKFQKALNERNIKR